MQYVRSIKDNGEEFVTVFDNALSEPIVATSEHPNYWDAIALLDEGDATVEEVEQLLNVETFVATAFENLSARVSVANGRVYFDGDEQHRAVADHIVRALKAGLEDDAISLALFMERLAANPSERSREQLYEWLLGQPFTITEDGKIVAYKGVRSDLRSINPGPATVNGKAVNGHVPNTEGAVVEFPRSKVTDDAAIGCASGLHVGTWDYASSFAQGAILRVIVDPRDVVSVPTDCEAAKVRVCRYLVDEVIEAPETGPVYRCAVYEDEEGDDWL